MGSRHLGLITAAEVDNLKDKLNKLAEICEKSVDVDGLRKLAKEAKPLEYSLPNFPVCEKIRIAVAKDEAFCFYYSENLRLLERMGAKLLPFSPLRDVKIPDEADGLYLGGGYPELYAKTLSENTKMLKSVADAIKKGLPTIAECGGFLYLNKSLYGFPMVGVLQGDCEYTNSPVRFGYATLTANKDNLLCAKGESIRAHEFHYLECRDCGKDFTVTRRRGAPYFACFANDNLYAGFPHVHFYSNLNSANRFYEKCH